MQSSSSWKVRSAQRKMSILLGAALLCIAVTAATKYDACSVSLPKQTASTSIRLTAQRNDTGFWTTQFGEYQVGSTVTACAKADCAVTSSPSPITASRLVCLQVCSPKWSNLALHMRCIKICKYCADRKPNFFEKFIFTERLRC